jgi:hypothetical protein
MQRLGWVQMYRSGDRLDAGRDGNRILSLLFLDGDGR